MYYHGIWFVGDGATQDWLGKLFKEGGRWVFQQRFRYYVGSEAFDSGDKKSWYRFEADDDSKESLARFLKTIHALVAMAELRYSSNADFVLLECEDSDPKFLFELGSRPWAHLKRVAPDEVPKGGSDDPLPDHP